MPELEEFGLHQTADGRMNTAQTLRTSQGTVRKIILLAAALFYLLFILRTSFRLNGELHFTLVDDAMVSMRYARHLAQGSGFVWNVGDKPVEGFTNPGWTLAMALFHLLPLPVSKISLAVMVLAGIVLLLNGIVMSEICLTLRPGARFASIIALTISVFYFPLVFWSLRGMEVGVLSLLTGVAVLVSLRWSENSWQRSAALLGLVFLVEIVTRMDSALQISVILIYLIAARKLSLRTAGIPLLIVALTLIGILGWQHAYFGDYLPNTYYQKIVGTSVEERIRNGLLVFNQYATRDTLLLAFASLGGVLLYREMRTGMASLLASLFVVQCAYSIWVGGDYAEPEVGAANRFITQGMPFLIVLFSLAADLFLTDVASARLPSFRADPRSGARVALGVGFVTLLMISGQPWINWSIDNAPLLKSDIRRVRLGLAIAASTSSTATIAVHAAGQIPYYSERRTIDMLGLNDPVIAKGPVTGPFYPGHDKWNYDYSIAQLRPDLIADNWVKLGEYMKNNTDYAQLENGMYVRKDSTLVNVDKLLKQSR